MLFRSVLERTLALAASDFDLRKRYDFRTIAIVRDFAADVPPFWAFNSKSNRSC